MIEIVFITNGRSTAEYALQSIQEQTVRKQIMVVENKRWLDAVNFGLYHVHEPYMLRVDDDMFLHPRALEFMLETMPKDSAMHRAPLYEHYSKMVAGKVRIYKVKVAKRIGGFKANRLGKIDRIYKAEVEKGGYKITTAGKKSAVGLHACAPWNEMVGYEALWGHKKQRRENMKRYKLSVEDQYSKRVKIIERYNRQNRTKFWEYLKSA